MSWQLKGEQINDTLLVSNDGERGQATGYAKTTAISQDGNIVAIGAGSNDRNDSVSQYGRGAVYVYEYNIDNWIRKGPPLVGEGPLSGFGTVVKLANNGTTLAVSAPNNDFLNLRGAVYIYDYNDSDKWQLRENSTFSGEINDQLSSIDITPDGNTLAITKSVTNIGKVQVYSYNDDNKWQTKGNEIQGSQDEGFGWGISISNSGDLICIPAPFYDSARGGVYMYSFNDTDWQPQSNNPLVPSVRISPYNDANDEIMRDITLGFRYGYYSSLSGDGSSLAISAPFAQEDDGPVQNVSGLVDVLKFNDSHWVPKGPQFLGNEVINQLTGFGLDVSTDGDTVVMGNFCNELDGNPINGFINSYTYNDESLKWSSKGQRILPTYTLPDPPGSFGIRTLNLNMSNDGNTFISGMGAFEELEDGITEQARVYSFNSSDIPCFIAGSLVTTDEGFVPIETVKAGKHTIRGKKIVKVTGLVSHNINKSDYLVCIKPSALDNEVPFIETICSPLHMIFYQGTNITAKKLLEKGIDGIYKQEYKGEKLYNIQLKEYSHMEVNGMRVETLHPRNVWAKKTIRK